MVWIWNAVKVSVSVPVSVCVYAANASISMYHTNKYNDNFYLWLEYSYWNAFTIMAITLCVCVRVSHHFNGKCHSFAVYVILCYDGCYCYCLLTFFLALALAIHSNAASSVSNLFFTHKTNYIGTERQQQAAAAAAAVVVHSSTFSDSLSVSAHIHSLTRSHKINFMNIRYTFGYRLLTVLWTRVNRMFSIAYYYWFVGCQRYFLPFFSRSKNTWSIVRV